MLFMTFQSLNRNSCSSMDTSINYLQLFFERDTKVRNFPRTYLTLKLWAYLWKTKIYRPYCYPFLSYLLYCPTSSYQIWNIWEVFYSEDAVDVSQKILYNYECLFRNFACDSQVELEMLAFLYYSLKDI